MDVTVIRPGELGPAEVTRWRELQEAGAALQNPFLAAEFAQAVDSVRPASRVAVIQDGGVTVGFFPFQLLSRNVAGPIGYGMNDLQALIVDPNFEFQPGELLKACGLTVWEFDHLIVEQAAFARHHRVRTTSPIVEVSDGYDAYLAALRLRSKSRATGLLAKRRRLERDLGEVRITFGADDPGALMRLMSWKSAQYRRSGFRDFFAEPANREVIERFYATSTPSLTGVLTTLHAGDRLVAADFGLRSRTVLTTWFPVYDPDLAKYSPGTVRLAEMIQPAADAGLEHLDLGKGSESYKQEFKTGDIEIAEGTVAIPAVSAYLWQARTVPRRYAYEFVLGNPRLRSAARATLRRVGAARSTVGRYRHRHPQ